MYDLLATRTGRRIAFTALYAAEGLPYGFTTSALTTHMAKQEVDAGTIARFGALLILPWSLKFVMGPLVDLVSSDHLGRRRVWIVGCQLMMAATLVIGMSLDVSSQIGTLAAVLIVHNVFAATQDVAIDALASSTLDEQERGTVSGLMWAGYMLGFAVGSSGMLFLTQGAPAGLTAPAGVAAGGPELPYLIPRVRFEVLFAVVAAATLCVTAFVSLWLWERAPTDVAEVAPRPGSLASRAGSYVLSLLRAFFGSRKAVVTTLLALLPAGTYSLGLALQSKLAVELGLDYGEVGTLTLLSTICAFAGSLAGGKLSDYFGRRRAIAAYIVLTALPALVLAATMMRYGWIKSGGGMAKPPATLVTAFWWATLVYNLTSGMILSSQMALFLDACRPAIAAAQFTAYMSMQNFVTFYSGMWQAETIERLGYPATLLIDSAACLSWLVLLPWMGRKPDPEPLDAEPVPQAV